MNEQITLGASAVMASLIIFALIARTALAPAGKHRSPASRPTTVPDPLVIVAYTPCLSSVCADRITEHTEIGEDQFRCAGCGRISEGAL